VAKALLADPRAYGALSSIQKQQLVEELPKDSQGRPMHFKEGPGLGQPDAQFLNSNDDFRNSASRFQEDVREGRNDADWLEEAIVASQNREKGEFDDFKLAEYEAFWGQKQKSSSNVMAGFTSRIKLEALFFRDVLKVGDIWSLSKVYKLPKGKGDLHIEKEAKVYYRLSDK
jgi:hypothetical protein